MICARAKGSFDTRTFFAGTAGFIQPRENGCARRSYAQNALQDAQERLRVLLGALCHAAQQAGGGLFYDDRHKTLSQALRGAVRPQPE